MTSTLTRNGRPKDLFDPQHKLIIRDGDGFSISKKYLESIGCSNPDEVAKSIIHDLTIGKPVSQIMLNLHSQSKYPGFNKFLEHTALYNLPQDNDDLYNTLQQSSYWYKKDICSPLPPYLLSNRPSFVGNPNKMYAHLSEVLTRCKNSQSTMPISCAHQYDVFFPLQQSRGSDESKEDYDKEQEDQYSEDRDESKEDHDDEIDDSDDDDEDDQYAARNREYAQKVDKLRNAQANKVPKSRLLLHKSFDEHPLSQGVDQTMRQEFKTFNKLDKFEPYRFSRHEMVFVGDSIYTFTTNDTIPPLSPECTPLFRHYHTINAINAMAVNLICFSYHVLQGIVQLFCYVHVDGRTHGQRVSNIEELEGILGSLYPTTTITRPVMKVSNMETHEDVDTDNTEVMIDVDPIYEEIKLVLYPRKICVNKKYIEYQQNAAQDVLIKIGKEVEINTKRLISVEKGYVEYELILKPQTYIGITSVTAVCTQVDLKGAENQYLCGIAVPNVNNTWTLHTFMTGNSIMEEYKMDYVDFARSCRQSPAFVQRMVKLGEKLEIPVMTEYVIDATNWGNVERNTGFEIATDTFKICGKRFTEQCKKSFKDLTLPGFRILVQDDNNHWIEWIKVIRVEYAPSIIFYTAIQYGYDERKRSVILHWLKNESPEELPYDLQVMVIQFCIPIKIKSYHSDPGYVFALYKAVGLDKSASFINQLLCLSPWLQFEIGNFQSELETFVEVLTARPRKRHVDISIIKQRVMQQNLEFNYSYFMINDIRVFQQTFHEISHGSLRRIYNAFGGGRTVKDIHKAVSFEINWIEANGLDIGNYDYKSN